MQKEFTHLLDTLLGSRFWALFRKEIAQLLRDRRLMVQILVPPTVALLLFGFALNPEVHYLKVGITDYSHSPASRDLIEVFNQTTAFAIDKYYAEQQDMKTDLANGKLAVGVVIPPEFAEDIARGRTAQVQAFYDAVDANTANLASGYVSQLVSDYNSRQTNNPPGSQSTPHTDSQRYQAQVQTTVLYNPGLENSWFIVSGMLGLLLTIIGSQTASSLLVREKEAGTIEQLLMTPASNTEVLLAKLSPILVVLLFDSMIALLLGHLVFGVPVRGSLLLFLGIGVIYFWVGISIGILLASFTKSQQQAQLIAFFINSPLILLSGAISPLTPLPSFMQWLSYLDPLRYFVEVCRGILLKGVGFETLWPQVLVLLVFATVLTFLSIRQFRRQMS